MKTVKISVALRFDDPSEISNVEIEKKVIAILKKYGLTATLGVVPFSRVERDLVALSASRAAHLIDAQQEQIIEIAQHGFCHDDCTSSTSGIPSEFLNLSASIQSTYIRRGLRHLESLFGNIIQGFIPPFNNYDDNTISALKEAEFKYVSGSFDAPSNHKLATLPGTCLLSSLRAIIESIQKKRTINQTVIAVMHHFDFSESGSNKAWLSLSDFDTLMAWLAAQPDVHVFTLGMLVDRMGQTKTRRALNNYRLFRMLPWRIQRHLPTGSLIIAPPWQVILQSLLHK